jgi:hypothetical protein
VKTKKIERTELMNEYDENYVYIKVKLTLKEDQTKETIQEIVSEMDYNFLHREIIDHEVIDTIDYQICETKKSYLFDMGFSIDSELDPDSLMDKENLPKLLAAARKRLNDIEALGNDEAFGLLEITDS